MVLKNVGFIGGGRVVSILLGGLARAGVMPERVVVSDVNNEVTKKLQSRHPKIEIALNNNKLAASQDLVFIAVHPPLIKDILNEIRGSLKTAAIVVSLAPKMTIAELSKMLGGFERIVRMIPNAPSIVCSGYNPIAFSESIPSSERSNLIAALQPLGLCPVISEDKLEPFAILTAMGPTYLWFQLYELCRMGRTFGLTELEAQQGICAMAVGAAQTIASSGLSAGEVMDLIPVKPLSDQEENIKGVYRSKLEAMYQKIKPLEK